MSIIVNINDRKPKLTSKKLMFHNFVIYPAIHGNSKLQFSGSGEDYDINIQLDNFNRSNNEVNMPVGCKVGWTRHSILK